MNPHRRDQRLLDLRRETIRNLSDDDLGQIAGGTNVVVNKLGQLIQDVPRTRRPTNSQ